MKAKSEIFDDIEFCKEYITTALDNRYFKCKVMKTGTGNDAWIVGDVTVVQENTELYNKLIALMQEGYDEDKLEGMWLIDKILCMILGDMIKREKSLFEMIYDMTMSMDDQMEAIRRRMWGVENVK